MTNQELIAFFTNLPYLKILIALGAIFVLLVTIKYAHKIGKLRTDKIRGTMIIIEFLLSILIIGALLFINHSNYTTRRLLETIMFILAPINFIILYTYFLEKITSLFSKILYFILSLVLSLIPSIVFSILIFQLYQILI